MNNFEMNSARNDRDFCNPKISKKSPVVEIFSQMVKGTELKGFDRSVINRSVKFIKSLAEKAKIGDIASACELNNIRRIVIEAVKSRVKTQAEKSKSVEFAKKSKLNDHDKIEFLEKYTGFKLASSK